MKNIGLLLILLGLLNPSYADIFEAAKNGDLKAVQQYIKNGVDVNAIETEDGSEAPTVGKTALMYASKKGQIEIVKLLVENGADINIKDEDGETALDLALGDDITEYLENLQ